MSTMTIDHPLDAGNAYLMHAVIASPEMLNVCTVMLDEGGTAVVELPSGF